MGIVTDSEGRVAIDPAYAFSEPDIYTYVKTEYNNNTVIYYFHFRE